MRYILLALLLTPCVSYSYDEYGEKRGWWQSEIEFMMTPKPYKMSCEDIVKYYDWCGRLFLSGDKKGCYAKYKPYLDRCLNKKGEKDE